MDYALMLTVFLEVLLLLGPPVDEEAEEGA